MRAISPALLAQLYAQESDDPFLMLVTFSHTSFLDDVRLVNNTTDIVSRGKTYLSFPLSITLPLQDGETPTSVVLKLDNVGRELIDELRTIDDFITVKLELILASLPNDVQMSIFDLKLSGVTFDATTISGTLFLDDFLNTKLDVETYGPSNYPGIF